jgi:cell division septation protein DedD
MKVEGKGDSAFAASDGADPKGQINMDAVPEAPVTPQPRQQAAQAPAPAPNAPPRQAAAPAPAPAPTGPVAGGATVQLGAFSNQASAERAWKALSGRFGYLAPLSHSVIPANVGGKTVYRLRASGSDARALCGRLRVAGESCVEV